MSIFLTALLVLPAGLIPSADTVMSGPPDAPACSCPHPVLGGWSVAGARQERRRSGAGLVRSGGPRAVRAVMSLQAVPKFLLSGGQARQRHPLGPVPGRRRFGTERVRVGQHRDHV